MLRDDSGDERDGDGRAGADQGSGVVAGDDQKAEAVQARAASGAALHHRRAALVQQPPTDDQ